MKLLSLFCIFSLLSQLVMASGLSCDLGSSNQNDLKQISLFSSTKNSVTECLEQEVIDPLLDPWKVQSFALSFCQKESACVDYLRAQVVQISGLGVERFANLGAVPLWAELQRYAGLKRQPAPGISDLPLSKDPNEIFEALKKQDLAKRSLNQSEVKGTLCSALFLIVGPNKLKGLKLAKAFSTPFSFEISKTAARQMKSGKIPDHIKRKFFDWKKDVEAKGLSEIRKQPGYHDEPIHYQKGLRSVRLNDRYRLLYEEIFEDGVQKIKVQDIINHDYAR